MTHYIIRKQLGSANSVIEPFDDLELASINYTRSKADIISGSQTFSFACLVEVDTSPHKLDYLLAYVSPNGEVTRAQRFVRFGGQFVDHRHTKTFKYFTSVLETYMEIELLVVEFLKVQVSNAGSTFYDRIKAFGEAIELKSVIGPPSKTTDHILSVCSAWKKSYQIFDMALIQGRPQSHLPAIDFKNTNYFTTLEYLNSGGLIMRYVGPEHLVTASHLLKEHKKVIDKLLKLIQNPASSTKT